MAKFELKPQATFEIFVTLTEAEARALLELSGFGSETIIEVLSKKLSLALGTRHGNGLRSFFDSCRGGLFSNSIALHEQLKRVDEARRSLGDHHDYSR